MGGAGNVAVGIFVGVDVSGIAEAVALGDGEGTTAAGVEGAAQAVKKIRVRIRSVFFIYGPV